MATVFVPWSVGPSVGLFGKVPATGDFVHLRTGDDQKLCDWLQRGVERANVKLGGRWPEVFDAGIAYGFVMRQASGAVVAGLITPSRDSVGRRFPLSAYASLSGSETPDVRHLLPWALMPLTQTLAACLTAGGQGGDPVESIRALGVQRVAGESGQAHYAEWLRSTPASGWFEQVWGQRDPEYVRYTVAMIASSVGPHRGQDHPGNPLALRLPLGGDLRAAAFWLDLVGRLAGWKATVPTLFWEAVTPTSVLVQLGEARPSSYVELWSRGKDDEHVIDLCSPMSVNAEPYVSSLSAPLLQRLSAEGSTLWDVLSAATP